MNALAGFNIHRGCLALVRRPPTPTLDRMVAGPLSRVLVLEGVNNPDNVGGLFRSAAAFGVELVVLGPDCGDPLYRKAVRTSMAASLVVPFAYATQWPGAIRDLRADGFTVVALTPNRAVAPLEEVFPHSKLALLVGAEGSGLGAEALASGHTQDSHSDDGRRRFAERHHRRLDRDVSLLRRTARLRADGFRRRGAEVPDRADADRSGVGGAGADVVYLVGAHAGAARVGGAVARGAGRPASHAAHRNGPAGRRPDDASTWTRLASVNRFATLCAYVADPARQSIRLHASVSMTEDNWLLARSIALHAMALQMADAYAEAAELAAAFGGRVAATPHPRQGLRERPDEMVGILEIYQQRGDGESPFDADEIAELVHLEPRPWVMAANELHRLDADLEFAEGLPARLELDASERHASLGSGLANATAVARRARRDDGAAAERAMNASSPMRTSSARGAWTPSAA